ncbi:MAG: F-type H+-transporting ATPase subunit b [Candidatus Marinamargulisbacteria bacterium]|jgi:F-type H+-transporting ATPase subunit b
MISINIYEILMQAVNFIVLIFLLNKFMYKPLLGYLEKRETAIENDLTEAKESREQAEAQLKEQRDLMQGARLEAKEIRQKAEEAMASDRNAAIAKTKEESERLVDNAKKEISLDFSRSKKELLATIGSLSVGLSEKILGRNLKAEDQEKIVSEYVEKIKN